MLTLFRNTIPIQASCLMQTSKSSRIVLIQTTSTVLHIKRLAAQKTRSFDMKINPLPPTNRAPHLYTSGEQYKSHSNAKSWMSRVFRPSSKAYARPEYNSQPPLAIFDIIYKNHRWCWWIHKYVIASKRASHTVRSHVYRCAAARFVGRRAATVISSSQEGSAFAFKGCARFHQRARARACRMQKPLGPICCLDVALWRRMRFLFWMYVWIRIINEVCLACLKLNHGRAMTLVAWITYLHVFYKFPLRLNSPLFALARAL